MRRLTLISSSAVVVALSALLACGGAPQPGDESAPQDPQSGGLESAPPEDSVGGEAEESQGGPANSVKITLCHIPPGNPANAHTITVGGPAVRAHVKHGDTLGACGGGEADAGTGGGEEDAGTGGGEEDAGTGGDVDAGPPACSPVGGTCGSGVSCCQGLSCGIEGYCEPVIG